MALTDRGYNNPMLLHMEEVAGFPRPVGMLIYVILVALGVTAVIVAAVVGGWLGFALGATFGISAYLLAAWDRAKKIRR